MNEGNNQSELLKRLESVINTAIDGIITIDKFGTIETINPAASKLFGYDQSELIGRNITSLMNSPEREEHQSYIDRYLETGQAKIIGVGREVWGKKKDGSTFPLRLAVSQMKLKDKIVFTGIVHDLSEVQKAWAKVEFLNRQLVDKVEERTSELRQAVSELTRTNEQLGREVNARKQSELALVRNQEELLVALAKEKDLNELKSRFMSMASHEFKTPLTTIKSSSSLVGKYQDLGNLQKGKKHLNRINLAVGHLNSMLDDFFSLSKLEEGEIQPKWQNIKLLELIIESVEEMSPLLKKDQTIMLDLPKKPIEIISDGVIMKNILYNLLTNAIKFSEPGTHITVKATSDEESPFIYTKDDLTYLRTG